MSICLLPEWFETGQNRQKRQIDKETNRRKSVYGDSKKLNCDRENTSLGGADKNIWEVFSRGGEIQKRKAIMAENIEEKYMLGISKDAKAIFRAVLKELNLNENIKLKLDFAVLSIFSQACVDYAMFNEKLQSDSLTPTEYYNLYNNRQLAKKDIMSSASKLGLTPTDRKRLGIEYTGDRKPTEVEKLLGIR